MNESTGSIPAASYRSVENIIEELTQILSSPYEDLLTQYKSDIDAWEFLGKHGWTVNYRKSNDEFRKWMNIVEAQNEALVAESFSEYEIEEMIDDLVAQYVETPERMYLERAVENYRIGHYTESAMFLLALMNYRINCISPDTIRKISNQCSNGLLLIGKESYPKLKNRKTSRLFLVRDAIPSLKGFATRTFVDGEAYSFENGTEPPYLNRNWLMHGRMTRLVKRYECIQLINALNTLVEIETTIQELDCEITGAD